MQIKLIFISMVSHEDSLWNWGTTQLGNGLFSYHWLKEFKKRCPMRFYLVSDRKNVFILRTLLFIELALVNLYNLFACLNRPVDRLICNTGWLTRAKTTLLTVNMQSWVRYITSPRGYVTSEQNRLNVNNKRLIFTWSFYKISLNC